MNMVISKLRKNAFFLNAIHYAFFNQTNSFLFSFLQNTLAEKEKGRGRRVREKKKNYISYLDWARQPGATIF